jgi:hypothetical protein
MYQQCVHEHVEYKPSLNQVIIYLFILGLFNGAFNYLDYTASNDRIHEWKIGKCNETRFRGLI